MGSFSLNSFYENMCHIRLVEFFVLPRFFFHCILDPIEIFPRRQWTFNNYTRYFWVIRTNIAKIDIVFLLELTWHKLIECFYESSSTESMHVAGLCYFIAMVKEMTSIFSLILFFRQRMEAVEIALRKSLNVLVSSTTITERKVNSQDLLLLNIVFVDN